MISDSMVVTANLLVAPNKNLALVWSSFRVPIIGEECSIAEMR
jgi:hypothetical protein